jgi:DNA replication and repair protein RecF
LTLALRLETLKIRGFRNISKGEMELVPRVNVISGDNGHGKTSILEALYFLSTSRSFRTERLAEVSQEGAEATRVEGEFREGEQLRRQTATIAGGRRSFTLDGRKPARLGSYATRTPLVVFHPGDLGLVHGPASARRTLLDRVALYVDAQTADARGRYSTAQRERQVVLEKRGVQAPELEVFETLMAAQAGRIRSGRQRAFEMLEVALRGTFSAMAASDLDLVATLEADVWGTDADFSRVLASRRDRDRQRRNATFGPHRDDLSLTLNGRPTRRHASQGQQRILSLALKLAELECIRTARGAQPILLLDDVSSELDPERTGAVYEFVRLAESQVLVTTTRPELFDTPQIGRADRRDFRLRHGHIEVV